MDIDITEYVDRDEIRNAILDGLRGFSRENAERIISNCGHHIASDVANEHLGENAKDLISEKAISLLDDLSQYTLFDGGGFGRPPSEARKILDNVVRENKEELSSSVRRAMHNLSKREVVDIVKSGKVKLVVE